MPSTECLARDHWPGGDRLSAISQTPEGWVLQPPELQEQMSQVLPLLALPLLALKITLFPVLGVRPLRSVEIVLFFALEILKQFDEAFWHWLSDDLRVEGPQLMPD